jgi:hypothetical protein
MISRIRVASDAQRARDKGQAREAPISLTRRPLTDTMYTTTTVYTYQSSDGTVATA